MLVATFGDSNADSDLVFAMLVKALKVYAWTIANLCTGKPANSLHRPNGCFQAANVTSNLLFHDSSSLILLFLDDVLRHGQHSLSRWVP